MGKIYSINISEKRNVVKKPVEKAVLVEGLGMEGDAHAAPGNRQVSLLAWESIQKQKQCEKIQKKELDLTPGDFAENITTEGVALVELQLGDTLFINDSIELRISKIGKECHQHCEIFKILGDCIMPREGIFAEVIKGGEISVNDSISIKKKS